MLPSAFSPAVFPRGTGALSRHVRYTDPQETPQQICPVSPAPPDKWGETQYQWALLTKKKKEELGALNKLFSNIDKKKPETFWENRTSRNTFLLLKCYF